MAVTRLARYSKTPSAISKSLPIASRGIFGVSTLFA